MTPEELKALWEAAKAKADAAPTDKVLATEAVKALKAYDDAVAEAAKAGDPPPVEDKVDGLDESKLDEKTKAYLAKLRGENAKHRLKSKDLTSKLDAEQVRVKSILKAAGIEDPSEKPEEQVKALTSTSENLAFNNAVLEMALEHGIPAGQVKYFKFLVSEAASALGENDELSEEDILKLATEAKKGAAPAGKANTGLGGAGGSVKPPPPEIPGAISLDEFCRMSITEKSVLYTKNVDLYTKLLTEAKAKKRLV